MASMIEVRSYRRPRRSLRANEHKFSRDHEDVTGVVLTTDGPAPCFQDGCRSGAGRRPRPAPEHQPESRPPMDAASREQ
jgi:hypothetical protein